MSKLQTIAEQPHGAGRTVDVKSNGAAKEKGFWATLRDFIAGFFAGVGAIAEIVNAVCSIAELCCLVAA